MARPLRFDFPGALHHVTSRGNGGRVIFRDDQDRVVFLQELRETARAADWGLLSYCLMPNHVHLLVETPSAGLSDGMQRLGSRFARHLHRRGKTYGHVYQGRFKSKVVTDDAQFAVTVPYIVRNPIVAGLCASPGEWPWSSHRAVVHGETSGLVAIDRLFDLLSGSGVGGRRRYADLIGSPDRAVPLPVPIPERPSLAQLLATNEDSALLAANLDHRYSVRQIAAVLGCSAATVTRRLARMKQEA
jgi:putative transposase